MSEPLTQAVTAINASQAIEREENSVATINDQIVENDLAIAANDKAIRAMQDAIRDRREDSRNRRATNARLRRQRAVFSRAAFQLRLIKEP